MFQNVGKMSLIKNQQGELFIAQQWNPKHMTIEDCRKIATELRDIANHLSVGEFEDEYKYEKFPLKETT